MALVGILMSTQLANAQQHMLAVSSNGKINVISISSVDYATFNADDKLFTISNCKVESSGTNSITADCTVSLSSESNVKAFSVTPEVGVCYSKYNSVPTIVVDDCLSLGSELKSYTFTLESLMSGTTYYFRTYVKLASGVFYGDVANVKTLGTAPVDNSKTINGHWFVDLGLPSGLLWAKTNIGAEKPADDGNYYAWGETTTKSTYSMSNYFDPDYTTYSINGKTTLEKQHDAACVNWGDSCRMPTKDEFEELCFFANCAWTWTSMTNSDGSSINGYKVTSQSNGNSIFLPASGRIDEGLSAHGSYGLYWSSMLFPSYSNAAYHLYFYSEYQGTEHNSRCSGRTVRPVAKP